MLASLRTTLGASFLAIGSLALGGCLDTSLGEDLADDISCNLSTSFASGRSMDAGRGVVYGAPLAPAPDVIARGAVEDLRFSVPTQEDTEDTLLEPTLVVEGDALTATAQSLSCATSESALLDGRFEARAVGTSKIFVQSIDGLRDSVSFEVREAATLEIGGPETAAVGEQLYLAADLRDAEDIPLYVSSSVTWSVVEGDVTFPEADEAGVVRGAFALVEVGSPARVVIQAEAVGFTTTITIAPR